jgi:hypothetical protein
MLKTVERRNYPNTIYERQLDLFELCLNQDFVSFLISDSVFKEGWTQLNLEWKNEDLKQMILPIFAIRDSIIDALGSASPSEFGVIIYASPLLDKYLKVSVCKEKYQDKFYH